MRKNGMQMKDRATGAMAGLALGDALGMPTQSMSAERIRQYYDGPITKLMNAVPQQPIAPNMKAGAVTDDTEQASYSHSDLSTITAALITPDMPTICCNGKLR